MSLKGFQKSLVRAPQTFKSRFNIGENTKDVVYSDAERRFQELEKETKKLHDESKKYFDAINGMIGLGSDLDLTWSCAGLDRRGQAFAVSANTTP